MAQKLIWVCFALLAPALLLLAAPASAPATAGTDQRLGPACGAATIDGLIGEDEWEGAAVETFAMISPGGAEPFTATLRVMNSGYYLYLGFTVNDDELSTSGTWLPKGDTLRIDFDNDVSGSLFALYDDALTLSAALPHFEDNYIIDEEFASIDPDTEGGGTPDGAGSVARLGSLNHFELRHPLCSGDALDFCLQPGGVVGFRLEYLDAQGDGSFGSSQFYPGSADTSEGHIVTGICTASDLYVYVPLVRK